MLFLEKIQSHAHLMPDQPALSQQVTGQWRHLTWAESWQASLHIAAGIASYGVKRGDRVAIMANNCIEWTLVDIACMVIGAVSVPVYATSSPEQIEYILNHSEAKLVFAEPELVALIRSLDNRLPTVNAVINMDVHPAAAETLNTLAHWQTQTFPNIRVEPTQSDDLLTIVYTSGTTGNPKGVMITHGNLLAAIEAHLSGIEFNAGDRSLAALPLSHIFERGWTAIALYAGGHNHYVADINNLQTQLQAVKPHVFCAVPRIFEKIHAGIVHKARQAGPLNAAILAWASARVRRNQQRKQQGKRVNGYARAMQQLATLLVGRKIAHALGGNIRFMPCGGAALDPDIHGFFMGLGINVKIGYGMTETLATVSFMPDNGYVLGTLGKPMTGIDIRIAEHNHEILVRSPSMTPGYYKDEKATSELIQDGWLHTGDAGHFDTEGNLVFEERLKELMKTSGGKYIAPQHVEGVLIREELFEQVAVIADARNYATALIVPAWEALEDYARSINLQYDNKLDLLRNSKILAHIEARLQAVQVGLARYEQIKRFTLLPREFSMQDGEITPTMKLRRKVISQRFADEIKAMY